jgi:hypothetical protein
MEPELQGPQAELRGPQAELRGPQAKQGRRQAARRLPKAWLAFLLGALLLAGAVIRLLLGEALVSTTLVYARSTSEQIPGARTPEDAVRSFYLMLDRGMYEEAWDIVAEPNWAGQAYVPYREAVTPGLGAAAPTPREQFVQRLNAELGYGGVWLKLHGVETRKVSEPGPPPAELPVAGLQAKSVCRVRADGRLLGACTIFSWTKELEVLEVDGTFRLLLEGTKRPSALFYQEWFTNVETIGTLRAVGS